MAASSGPDPRFDPRFQRGYDGPEPAAPSTPAMPSPIEAAAAPRRAAELSPRSEAGSVHAMQDPADLSAPAAPAEDDGVWTPPRRNPFAVALLVGSLVMIGVGLWFFWSVFTASSYPDGSDRAALMFQLIQQQLTPALLIVGLLGVIGWLSLGAVAVSNDRRE